MAVNIGKTTAAMCAGVATVGVGGLIMQATDKSVPPPFAQSFSNVSRWDQSTFLGRYKKMFSGCNPMLLANSSETLFAGKARIDELKARVEAGESDLGLSEEENLELWQLKEVVDSGINSATGELIPQPFRMSGYVPFNGPICVAMVSSTGTAALLFWAWLNQSQNAMINYFNKGSSGETHAIDADWVKPHDIPHMFAGLDQNGSGYLDRGEIRQLASKITSAWGEDNSQTLDAAMGRLNPSGDGKITLEEFTTWFETYKNDEQTLAAKLEESKETEVMMQSYGTAVALSLGMTFFVSLAIKKKFPPERANQILKFVAFPASVTASSINCYIVRKPEIPVGFPLMDEQGNVVGDGNSSAAAAKGVMETTTSRAILQVPVYFLPPLLMTVVPTFRNMVVKNPAIAVPLTTYLLLVSFGFGLPFAVAVFPQIGHIDASEVEAKFQGLKGADGRVLTRFHYDKGL